MLTDQCNIFLDEALTAIDNNSKLSVEATAHLETCIECRRSLESIKALKASTATVLPIAALGLKSKIATQLEGAMKARSAVSVGSKFVKTTLATGSVLLGLGLAGVLTCGVIGLSSPNKSEIPIGNSKQNYKNISVSQVATISTNINKSDTSDSSVNIEDNAIGDNSDLRAKESLEEHSKTFYPSVIVDEE